MSLQSSIKYILSIGVSIVALTLELLGASAADSSIGPQAIWEPSQGILNHMKAECWNTNPFLASPEAASLCCIDIMKRAGAAPEALSFTRTIFQRRGDVFCYMSSFKKLSIVDIAELACPFKDDSKTDTVLLNGRPAIVEINSMTYLSKIDILSDPEYSKTLQRHSEPLLWPYTAGLDAIKKLPGGGERYAFDFKLLNGCETCQLAATMKVGYDFDADGNFLGVELISLIAAD